MRRSFHNSRYSIFSKMFLPLLSLLLLSLRCALADGVAAPPVKTFTSTDPDTGKQVVCDQCAPGTYLSSRCTVTQKSVCVPCPAGSYTELWNYINKCERCSVCGRNQVVKKECSVDSDRQCECKQGYYMTKYGMCLPHTKCPLGEGVQTKGTPTLDTVCQVCPNGTYSNMVSDQQSCMQHQNCEAAGMLLVLNGSTWHDSVCTSCEELRSKDGAEYLREILPAFFVHQKINVTLLRQIVQKLPSENGKKQEGDSSLDILDLLAQINTWIESATAEQLRDLPTVITKIGAASAGEILQNKLQQIDTCSVNRDHQCNCKQGSYLKYGMCLPHTKCPLGEGVQIKGTPTLDTVCQVCPNGTYSNMVSDQQSCMQHQNCEAAGMLLVLNGSTWHDSVCTSCEELRSKDGAEYLRKILPPFFVHHRINIKRLRQIVQKLPSENGMKHRRVLGLGRSSQILDLLAQINTWVESATTKQLRDLPTLMNMMGAASAGDRLQNKLQEIDAYSANRDHQCDCEQGYYLKYGMCLPHTKCPLGEGVQTKGTPTLDTVCQVCPNGTYSNMVSDQQSCMQHQNCEAAGLQVMLNGSTLHDSVCLSCEELTPIVRQILPEIFPQRMNDEEFRQIMHKLPFENSKIEEGVLGGYITGYITDLHVRIDSLDCHITADPGPPLSPKLKLIKKIKIN